MVLKEGSVAPNIEVSFHDGSRGFLLPRNKHVNYVVLYFFPRAFTSGCTRETIGFNHVYEDLKKKGIEIIGVSADDLDRQRKFAEKHGVRFKLVADPDLNIIRLYDVVGKTGKSAARVTYIIEGSSHKIIKVFERLKKADEHVDKVSSFFKK